VTGGHRTAGRHSFFGDVLSTTATQAVTGLLNAASLAIISRRLGDHDLGLYTLERRGCALIGPMVLLGVTVATPRYIALAVGKGSDDHRSYALTGAVLVTGAAAAIGAVILIWPEPVAAIVFGDGGAVSLARALGGFVVAAALYQMVYAIFRGYLQMARANALELATVGLLPTLIAAAGPLDVVAFMWTLTGAVIAVTVVSVAPWRWWTRRGIRAGLRRWRWRGRELLRYGLPRTPGDFAIVVPFALTPIVVVHLADATQAGYTSVVLSTLNLLSVAAAPLGVLILPHVALELGQIGGRRNAMWARLAEATLDVALVSAALLFLASPLVVAVWFPDVPAEVVTAERMIAVGTPGYVFYVVFRSYLDAVDARPLSSIPTITGLLVLGVALPVLLLTDPFSSATVAAAAAVAISVTAMGAITWWLVRPRLAEALDPRALGAPLLAVLAILALGVAVRGAAPAAMLMAAALAGLAYAALLVGLRRPWITQLGGALRSRAGARSP
jgi:O-antigen/teichoic acid export membrane protein